MLSETNTSIYRAKEFGRVMTVIRWWAYILYTLMNTSEPKNGYLLKFLPFIRICIAVYSTTMLKNNVLFIFDCHCNSVSWLLTVMSLVKVSSSNYNRSIHLF